MNKSLYYMTYCITTEASISLLPISRFSLVYPIKYSRPAFKWFLAHSAPPPQRQPPKGQLLDHFLFFWSLWGPDRSSIAPPPTLQSLSPARLAPASGPGAGVGTLKTGCRPRVQPVSYPGPWHYAGPECFRGRQIQASPYTIRGLLYKF